ncbi:MAG: STM4015 family protein [Lachnospiraceae bacterium]|nr:STM4015 family protein [Lachnospiraceae bacterium]
MTEKLKRKKFSYSWEDEEDDKNVKTMLEEILESKRLPHVEELVIGCWGECYDDSVQVIVDGIVEHKEQFQHIKSLFIGDMEREECEVSWILQADYSKLWEALPNLEKLTIKGSSGLSLGIIEHNNLKELEIICGGLPKSVIHSIVNAKLPQLTSLNLYIGSKEYGFDGDMEDIRELLAHPFPKLTRLGLVDSEMQDEITAEVVKSPYMNQISELALSKGTLSNKGGRLLLEEVPKHPNITFLDLEYHYMSAKTMLQLLELPIDVNVDEQKEVYETESYWYPMLTE